MGLHDLVVAYAGQGDHRTGTAVDDRMRAWFSDEVASRGCTVTAAPYDFPQFVADVEVTVDGGSRRIAPALVLVDRRG